MFTSCVYDLTFISGGAGPTGEKAAMTVSSVRIFLRKTLGQFTDMFV